MSVDGRRVGVLGFSADGHLAGSTAVFGQTSDGPRPDSLALLYSGVTPTPPYLHEGSRDKLLGTSPTAEMIGRYPFKQRVRAGTLLFFLAHPHDDQAVSYQNSEMLATALRRVESPVELLLVGSGSHGFALGRHAESARWKDTILAWLDCLGSIGVPDGPIRALDRMLLGCCRGRVMRTKVFVRNDYRRNSNTGSPC